MTEPSQYCPHCHKHELECKCEGRLFYALDDAQNTLKVAEFRLKLQTRDRNELVAALKELIESSPCDPDTTKRFLAANQKAAELISKYSLT
jgi:hypothetical protein